jgi:uncharacterized phiE125 gp8 family phage protein
MNLVTITEPTAEPVSLSEAKLHLRVDHADEDTLISGLISGARGQIEALCWHALMTQTLELVLDGWPCGDTIELPHPPLQSVTSISYKDVDGVTTTLASDQYSVAKDSEPGRIVLAPGCTWPGVTLWTAEAIRVRFVAGWLSAAAVPQRLKQALLLLVGEWYAMREANAGNVQEIPFAVSAICGDYRLRVRRS